MELRRIKWNQKFFNLANFSRSVFVENAKQVGSLVTCNMPKFMLLVQKSFAYICQILIQQLSKVPVSSFVLSLIVRAVLSD